VPLECRLDQRAQLRADLVCHHVARAAIVLLRRVHEEVRDA
jgi:hypothetical protein